MPKEV